eukprot:g42100.t1
MKLEGVDEVLNEYFVLVFTTEKNMDENKIKDAGGFVSQIRVSKDVMKKIDEGRAMDVVYMDFTKASHKVHHSNRLIQKMKSHGIHNEL